MTTTTQHDRSLSAAMSAGLGLTVLAVIVPYVDRATTGLQAEHIQAGYPTYGPAQIDTALTLYLTHLSVVGALGIIGWLTTIWAVRAGKRWARGVATAMFVLGTSVALFNLQIEDTSGDTGLSPVLGVVGLIPCLAGLVVVGLLWRRSGRRGNVSKG